MVGMPGSPGKQVDQIQYSGNTLRSARPQEHLRYPDPKRHSGFPLESFIPFSWHSGRSSRRSAITASVAGHRTALRPVTTVVSTLARVIKRIPLGPIFDVSSRDSRRKNKLSKGITVGAAMAPVQLMEFESVECPSCGRLGESLKTLRGCYPDLVAVIFVPRPLLMHQCSDPSAQMAECTDQDDLPGTPTLLINGWKLKRLPSPNEFDQMIMAILGGENPVSEFQASADAHGAGGTGLAACTPKDHRSQTPVHFRKLR